MQSTYFCCVLNLVQRKFFNNKVYLKNKMVAFKIPELTGSTRFRAQLWCLKWQYVLSYIEFLKRLVDKHKADFATPIIFSMIDLGLSTWHSASFSVFRSDDLSFCQFIVGLIVCRFVGLPIWRFDCRLVWSEGLSVSVCLDLTVCLFVGFSGCPSIGLSLI